MLSQDELNVNKKWDASILKYLIDNQLNNKKIDSLLEAYFLQIKFNDG